MDRNPISFGSFGRAFLSLSARRAWIEMQVFQRIAKPFRVALRKESVDRNYDDITGLDFVEEVALRKESVDRNFVNVARAADRVLSLSARRAWIEIERTSALFSGHLSLSARRAWIEIRWGMQSPGG